MPLSFRVALQIPENEKKYFSFKLHQDTTEGSAECKQSKKLLVVSGMDGHFQSFCDLLIKSEVLDDRLNWTFLNNHLIILGNCIKAQEESVEFLWFIYSLEEQAQLAGGAVHFILGTHELSNINGEWINQQPKYAKRKSASKGAVTALYDGNREIRRWLLTKNVVEKIGNTLFVYGGVSRELLMSGLSIREINLLCKRGYSNINQPISSLTELLLNGPNSLIYYQYNQEFADETLIDDTLNHFNVDTIVTGNNASEHVSSYFDNKVISVGSDYSESRPEALFVKYDRFYKFNIKGKLERIKQTGTGDIS